MTPLSNIKVLVSAGSKHGATAEIADAIGETLAGRGSSTTVAKPDDVTNLAGYQAVVLGSAVYAGHCTGPAKNLAERVAVADPKPEVWLFSSGPVGDPPKPDEDSVDVTEIIEATSAREHRVFSGKIDKSKLGFAEKAILIAVRAPEGDFTDWDEIAAWTQVIADDLETEILATE